MTFIFLYAIWTNVTSCSEGAPTRHKVEIQGEWLVVDGEKFFVKGVGYAGWRPHQWPGTDQQVDLGLVDRDFQMIKEAGFNTIRSWSALTDEELTIAEKYGLMVIQGIWIDPDRDFSDPYFQQRTLEDVRRQVEWSSKHGNILMYLLMTEPTPEAVIFSGEQATLSFFRQLKATVQAIDPKPVSMNSWLPLGFLDHSIWDVVTFNAFMFVPESPNVTLGFREYVRWLKETHAQGKPFLIGETGGFSVSKKKIGTLPFGGNTEEEQSKGNLTSLDECIAAGATGTCLVAWIDTWHYPSDPDRHDDEPWEWDGILGIPNDNDLEGIPRKIYDDVKDYNQAIVIRPASPARQGGPDSQKMDTGLSLSIQTDKPIYDWEESPKIYLKLTHEQDQPVANKEIHYGFFLPVEWLEEVGRGRTNAQGILEMTPALKASPHSTHLIIFAATEGGMGSVHFLPYRYSGRKPSFPKGPFYIYHDKGYLGNHYYYSGWMGDRGDIKLDDHHTESFYSGRSAIKITYLPKNTDQSQHWGGVYWQEPLNNWANRANGYNLKGAAKLTFWARGEKGGEKILKFSIGGVQGHYPDSDEAELKSITLTKEWKQYVIDLQGKNLENICTGFGWVTNQILNPNGCTFYIDEIRYESH